MSTTENLSTTQFLENHLALLKSKGYTRRQSIEMLKTEMFDAQSVFANSMKSLAGFETAHGFHNRVIRPGELGKVYRAVYGDDQGGLTPLDLAQDAKLFYDNPDDVAIAVKAGFPGISATDVGKLLLDPTVYPDLSSGELRQSLLAAGFSEQETSAAVAALINNTTTVTVYASQEWQTSGVRIKPGERVNILYKSGMWTANPSTGFVNAGGNPAYIAKSGYTLQGAPEGALIGRTDSRVFLIGNGGLVPAAHFGELLLCINDDMNQQYGAGFADNSGAIIVEIEKNKP
ncbi:hypothetical protein [Negadavirga shengliensis]|uniref:Uncharacterized protein n=1 Tax=Negadavirga shengliensis TaxID=1389218 RepID=A0ABV9SZR2_9BACT